MIGGTLSLALTNVDVTLTTDQSRDLTIRCTGTLSGNVILTTPGIGFYFVDNATTGAFTVTLQYTGAVGPITIPQGFVVPVIVDATNGVRSATGIIAGVLTRQALFDATSIKGTDIASAATVNLETATGSLVDVTGTTTVTAITLSEGHRRIVRFTGILTLTNGASLVLPGAANIVTAAGDYAVFVGYAAGVVRCAQYQRAATAPNAAASDTGAGPIAIATTTDMKAASSVLLAVTPGRQPFHPAHPKAGGSLDGTTSPPAFRSGDYGMGAVTDNGAGNYTLALDTAFANTSYWANGWARFPGGDNSLIMSGLSTGAKTASTFQISMSGPGAGFVDSSDIGITFWGEYA